MDRFIEAVFTFAVGAVIIAALVTWAGTVDTSRRFCYNSFCAKNFVI